MINNFPKAPGTPRTAPIVLGLFILQATIAGRGLGSGNVHYHSSIFNLGGMVEGGEGGGGGGGGVGKH